MTDVTQEILGLPFVIIAMIYQYSRPLFSDARELFQLAGLYRLAFHELITCGVNSSGHLVIIDNRTGAVRKMKVKANEYASDIQISSAAIYTESRYYADNKTVIVSYAHDGIRLGSYTVNNTCRPGTCYGDKYYIVSGVDTVLQLDDKCYATMINIPGNGISYNQVLVREDGRIITWIIIGNHLVLNTGVARKKISLEGRYAYGDFRAGIFRRNGEYFVPIFAEGYLVQLLIISADGERKAIITAPRGKIAQVAVAASGIYLVVHNKTTASIDRNKVLYVKDVSSFVASLAFGNFIKKYNNHPVEMGAV